MIPQREPMLLGTGLLLLALLCACGSDGGPAAGPLDGPTLQQALVVQYDHDADGALDWLTVDTSAMPYRVVEALKGTPGGEPINATAILKGQPIDVAISEALASRLAGAFAVGERMEIQVRDSDGRAVPMVLFR